MFRKMRRPKQALSEEEIYELLRTEKRGVLSVIGDDGYPYGVPINHIYDDESGKIYFHGASIGHRVDAVKRDPKVSYCVYGQDEKRGDDWAYYVKSVVAFGKAEIITDSAEVERISRLICAKFPCPQEYVEHEVAKDLSATLCVGITIESITGKLVHEA